MRTGYGYGTFFGFWVEYPYAWHVGLIDEVHFFNRALSGTEVRNIYYT
jgi:hypothetical protein